MNTLDDTGLIKKLDPKNTLDSIGFLADQCESAWNEASKVKLPENYKEVKAIVVSGMGGSSYGARIIKSLYGLSLPVPLELISDYHLPSYVDDDTLVVAASYSGTTEETISCAREALAKNAKLIGISSGGPLFDLLTAAGKPFYRFDPEFNPSGQPRIGQGYMQIGQMALLTSLSFLKIKTEEIKMMITLLRSLKKNLQFDVPLEQNEAKILATRFAEKIVNFIAAEFLEGATHAIRNPVHETGKHFANYFIVPELNHHLMEGLSFPDSLKKDFLFALVNSSLYSPVIAKRMGLTKEVIEKNNIDTVEINLKSTTKLGQTFELIQLGSFVTFYLAMIHGIDPAKIPWVDYFKNQLKK